jgi:hypothetical protein
MVAASRPSPWQRIAASVVQNRMQLAANVVTTVVKFSQYQYVGRQFIMSALLIVADPAAMEASHHPDGRQFVMSALLIIYIPEAGSEYNCHHPDGRQFIMSALLIV